VHSRQPGNLFVCPARPARILDFSERGQGSKTELVEACDFMGTKPKNSSWNHGFRIADKEGIAVQGVFTRRVAAKEVLDHDEARSHPVIRGF